MISLSKILFPLLMCSLLSAAGVGEFELPDTLPLPLPAVVELRELVETDAEALALLKPLAAQVKPLIGQPATPLKTIYYQGLVNTAPRRIETVKHLKQMGDAALLLRYWQATGDAKSAETLKDWSLAWFSTYEPNGDDVNENKLFPLLVFMTYFLEELTPEQQQQVRGFIAEFDKPHVAAVRKSNHLTNRYTKHVRLAVVCGLILEKAEWVATGEEGVKRFVTQSLYADGRSHDLELRDTLTYQNSALRPPIQIAMLIPGGDALYSWQNEKGGSLKKSVDYVVPYALGEKTREEWRNTKVALDRQRAAAGLEYYRPGRLYEPKNALPLMKLAAYYDPELMKVVLHLTDNEAERFPTWQTLLNAAVAQSRVAGGL